MTYHILRPATCHDAWDLIYPDHMAKLSPIDQDTMHRVVVNSTLIYLGLSDDDILCIYGLTAPTLLSDRAYLWLWTTEHFHAHVFAFIRHSQRVIEDALAEYPIIVGHGRVGDTKSLRWLRWLGAEFGTPLGETIPFQIKAPPWQQSQA